ADATGGPGDGTEGTDGDGTETTLAPEPTTTEPPTTTTTTPPPPPPPAAGFDALVAAVGAGAEVVTSPWVEVDPPRLEAGGVGDVLPELRATGADVLRAVLGRRPETHVALADQL